MDNENDIPFGPAHPRYLETLAFCMSVDTIRKAQGKSDPKEFAFGTHEWMSAQQDLMRDTLRMMGIDPGVEDC
ncbi:hypothetical protein [Paraburkholderia sp.]|uniref:hypothetical protein n=1 Tax=Paraburkholderia sp. TaxID=1926495 RepID=UPI00238359E6|nr:hypothetical protein [Paraburkholderia sp.]MDE1184236.1 hypothetical protein [Paraburkholderia sp.]